MTTGPRHWQVFCMAAKPLPRANGVTFCDWPGGRRQGDTQVDVERKPCPALRRSSNRNSTEVGSCSGVVSVEVGGPATPAHHQGGTMYDVSTATMGALQQEEVNIVTMPRETFMAIFEQQAQATQELEEVDLRPQLLPIAQAMTHYPLSQWVDNVRGCGCVVGEYLIAADVFDRSDAPHINNSAIARHLDMQPNGAALRDFGEEIDSRLRSHLRERLGNQRFMNYTCQPGDLVIWFVD